MRYFAASEKNLQAMYKTLGITNYQELFSSIPKDHLLNKDLNLPLSQDELSIKRELSPLQSSPQLVNFIGAGATAHFVPEWVSQQLLRAEWYTSYTPYQPEISQGILTALFEFQSMVASLFGLSISNSSMYDGATALAEAILLAYRVNHKSHVLVSRLMHPEYREVIKTYLAPAGIKIHEINFNSAGQTCFDHAKNIIKNLDNSCCAIAIQHPNFFSNFEELENFSLLAKNHQALLITNTTEPLSCALTSSVGDLGADIAVGEGLGFCGDLNLGGPGVGLFACQERFLRQIPGRLVGYTHDSNNNPGFVLTLSTREQHIRRERATSNICTNHTLTALAFAMTLSAYGHTGFKNLAYNNLQKTHYFRELLKNKNINIKFSGPHFNETVVNLGCPHKVNKLLLDSRVKNYICGLALGHWYPELDGSILIATTELHTNKDIETISSIIAGV